MFIPRSFQRLLLVVLSDQTLSASCERNALPAVLSNPLRNIFCGAGAIVEQVGCLPCTRPNRVWFPAPHMVPWAPRGAISKCKARSNSYASPGVTPKKINKKEVSFAFLFTQWIHEPIKNAELRRRANTAWRVVDLHMADRGWNPDISYVPRYHKVWLKNKSQNALLWIPKLLPAFPTMDLIQILSITDIFFLFDNTRQCSGVTPGSFTQELPLAVLGDYMRFWESNLGWSSAKYMP